MSESLKHKTLNGVGWSFVDNIASSGITFIVGLVLARLLTPAEYGIIAIIMVFIAISNSIVDCGFSGALVRKMTIHRIDYNTVFFFNLVTAFFLYLVLFLCANFISVFFNEPILAPVMKILGIVLVFNSLGIIQRTILIRDINFKTQAKVSFIASIISGIIGIGLALCGYGVWSLVGQQLSRQFFNSLFLWIYGNWYPVFEFSISSFKDLFGFGSKLLLSGLIDTVYKNVYYIIIGRYFTSSVLGQYTRAEQFNMIFSTNLTSVVQRVSYPVLSSIQNEPNRLRQAYQMVIKTTMLITFACMLGLAAVAKPLILILIGEKWLEAVYYLQIICFSGMLYPLHAINLNILQVKGRSDLCLKLEIIKKIVAVFPISIGIFYGIEYMLWGSVCTSIISFFLNSYYSALLIQYSTKNQIMDMLPTFCVSFLIAIAIWSLSLIEISIYILLPLQCLLGICLAILCYEKMKLEEYVEVKKIVFSFIKKMRYVG